MSSSAFRCQVRLSLSDLDRGIEATRTVVMAQQPDEPDEHILLRFLAQVLFFEEQLRDSPGWIDVHEPDLRADDLTGQLALWIECQAPPMKRLEKALGRHKNARFVALFGHPDEAELFRQAVIGEKMRHVEQLEIWTLPAEFMAELERGGKRSMTWNATIADHTLYLESDGENLDCVPEKLPPATARHGNSAIRSET
jgi:uncharacterized protein YaeQ